MRQAKWTPEAKQDLARIDDYHRARDPGYADLLGTQILATARFVAEQPEGGKEVGVRLRKKNVTRSSYLLMYRILPQRVEILRVRHNKEDWRPL